MLSTNATRINEASLFITIGRLFFRLAIIGLGFQQFLYGDFRPVFVPDWPAFLHTPALGFLSGAFLIVAALLIAFRQGARGFSLALGFFFLILFLACHVPYQLHYSPYSFHLGLWTDPLKELALAGGAFIMASTFMSSNTVASRYPVHYAAIGRFFFCLMLIVFGIDHFIYTDFVASLVPSWIPGPVFWTYFGAIALIGAGAAILLNIFRFPVSLLLALILFLWVALLHIPRAVVATSDKGNELTSVFEALAFSGVALMIAGLHKMKRTTVSVF